MNIKQMNFYVATNCNFHINILFYKTIKVCRKLIAKVFSPEHVVEMILNVPWRKLQHELLYLKKCSAKFLWNSFRRHQ